MNHIVGENFFKVSIDLSLIQQFLVFDALMMIFHIFIVNGLLKKMWLTIMQKIH